MSPSPAIEAAARALFERDLAVSYARVKCTLVRTTLGKAEKADTDKHRNDLILSALAEARGIVAALERAKR